MQHTPGHACDAIVAGAGIDNSSLSTLNVIKVSSRIHLTRGSFWGQSIRRPCRTLYVPVVVGKNLLIRRSRRN